MDEPEFTLETDHPARKFRDVEDEAAFMDQRLQEWMVCFQKLGMPGPAVVRLFTAYLQLFCPRLRERFPSSAMEHVTARQILADLNRYRAQGVS